MHDPSTPTILGWSNGCKRARFSTIALPAKSWQTGVSLQQLGRAVKVKLFDSAVDKDKQCVVCSCLRYKTEFEALLNFGPLC